MNVLLIEPFTELRVMLRSVLNSLGVDNLHEPRSSLDGMQILASGNIDLMICAQSIQPFNGVLSIKMVRFAKEEDIRYIRTILSSNGIDDPASKQAINVGADAILAKPFSADDVRTLILKVINNRGAFLESPKYTGPCRRLLDLSIDHDERRDPQFNPGRGNYTRTLRQIVRRILNVREGAANKKLSAREEELKQRGIIIDDGHKIEEESLHHDELQVGMVITRPILTNTEMLVLPAGTILSPNAIKRFKDLAKMDRIETVTWVQKGVIREELNDTEPT